MKRKHKMTLQEYKDDFNELTEKVRVARFSGGLKPTFKKTHLKNSSIKMMFYGELIIGIFV